MNRNTILGFAGGLVFAISLLIALVVADNATDQGGGEARLPGALGDPIEIISGIPISDPDAPVGFPIEPTQAAYLPIDTGGGSGGGAGSSGGGGVPAGGGGSPADGDTAADGTELTVAPLAPEDGVIDADFRFDDFFSGDLYFEFLEYPLFRFLDLCADDGALPGCPPGVGGTVFAPFGDPPDADFRLGSTLRDASVSESVCDAPEDDQHPFFVWANHPARFDITYYPPTRSTGTTVTVSNNDTAHPEYVRYFDDFVEGRIATSAWPRECFLLTEIPVEGEPYRQYTVEVNATSFRGFTASETYTVDITSGPRPPVVFVPGGDSYIRALIPIKSESQTATMTLINESDTTTCVDVEAEGRMGAEEIIPTEFYGHILDRGWRRDAYPEPGPSWSYDRAYDWQQIIDVVEIQGGTTYLACIWWFESPERSFDSEVVVEREMRWITTPNRPSAVVWAHSIQNTSGRTIGADWYTVGLSCGLDSVPTAIPPADMIWGAELGIASSPVLCDYGGGPIQIPTVGFFVTPRGFRHEFTIALDPNGSIDQRFSVDLSTVGLSFDEPGPTLTLHAVVSDRFGDGPDRWRIGARDVFEPPPAVP